MHVISQKALRDFAIKHPNAGPPLGAWLKIVKNGKFANLAELKRTFPNADMVPLSGRDYYVFNVGGGNYRLIASIHFKTQKLFIRRTMTHAEYSKGHWKKNP